MIDTSDAYERGGYPTMEAKRDPADKGKNQSQKALNVAYRGYTDGTVEFFGDQIGALTGYTKDDFNSKRVRWTDLIFDADKAICKQAFVHALKCDKTYMREYRIRHRDGQLVWFQEWGQIICNADSSVESVIGVILNITERKRMEEAQLKIDRLTGKYLMFLLGNEQFGVSILKVREIIGMLPTTAIPGTPDYLCGVINLRGKVIPVFHLRLKLGMAAIDPNERTCVVLVEVEGEAGMTVVGMIVDGVSEVVHVLGSDIDESPDIISSYNGNYIVGMAKTTSGIKILLDVDRLDLGADLTQVQHAA